MYQALYRKYRPKTFDELLGQKHITTTLKNQVLNDNIAHAYLFSGTRGTGKTSAAKILSRAVNCLNPKDGNPCNECDCCKGILNESIMDVIEMDAASNNSVDDVRDLREKVIYPPARTKYKVYIIDEVHMLSKGAFNALLKTLEEPPKHLIFILATTEPERLPQTILSRCQRFDFKRITTKDIVENMRNITDELKVEIDDNVLRLIARNSDGAMRDALSLLDQCFSFNGEKVTYEDAIDILGIANKDLIQNMVINIRDKNLEKVLMSIDEIIQDGKDINQFIKDLINYFRDLMIVKTSSNPKEILEIDNLEPLKEVSNNMSLDYILKALNTLTNAEVQGKWSTQPRIVLEMAVVKLIDLENEMSLEERVKRLEQGIRPIDQSKEIKEDAIVPHKNIAKSIADKIKSTEDIKPAADKIDKREEPKQESVKEQDQRPNEDDGYTFTIEKISNEWEKVLQKIKLKKINLYALILEGELLSFENGMITIGYKESYSFHRDAINTPQNKEIIEEIISKYFNRDIVVNFIIKGEPANIHKENKKEEAIKSVIDFFGEENVEIK
ncbi:DNA polymerase III subunit gamma/tau [Tissierellaceae bacterium BX21]|uniref:DNA-directed DNA polymerase n=2 Tax=Paratissierella segnis TaxID=2763679 RepID=A0A926IK43_9FIRM|nr:DNA polymerase III subunit gamma/tau [Paratissierella segnis]